MVPAGTGEPSGTTTSFSTEEIMNVTVAVSSVNRPGTETSTEAAVSEP